jgi:hypothetical protein
MVALAELRSSSKSWMKTQQDSADIYYFQLFEDLIASNSGYSKKLNKFLSDTKQYYSLNEYY